MSDSEDFSSNVSPYYYHMSPCQVVQCENAEKIRALQFNEKYMVID